MTESAPYNTLLEIHMSSDHIIMYEDWSVRPDGTYYRYRFEGETEWHEKLTGHKGSPFVKFVALSQAEVTDLVARDVIEPPKAYTKSAPTIPLPTDSKDRSTE